MKIITTKKNCYIIKRLLSVGSNISAAAVSQEKNQTLSAWATNQGQVRGKIPSHLTPSQSSDLFRNKDKSA